MTKPGPVHDEVVMAMAELDGRRLQPVGRGRRWPGVTYGLRMNRRKVGPGGAGAGGASQCDRRRRSSSLRLCSPLHMAQRWFAEKIGRISQDMCRNSGFSAAMRQS